MADEVDITQDRMEKEAQAMLELHRNRGSRTQVLDRDGDIICADCGGSMQLGRKLNGYANCIECQTEAEKSQKINRRVCL